MNSRHWWKSCNSCVLPMSESIPLWSIKILRWSTNIRTWDPGVQHRPSYHFQAVRHQYLDKFKRYRFMTRSWAAPKLPVLLRALIWPTKSSSIWHPYASGEITHARSLSSTHDPTFPNCSIKEWVMWQKAWYFGGILYRHFLSSKANWAHTRYSLRKLIPLRIIGLTVEGCSHNPLRYNIPKKVFTFLAVSKMLWR